MISDESVFWFQGGLSLIELMPSTSSGVIRTVITAGLGVTMPASMEE